MNENQTQTTRYKSRYALIVIALMLIFGVIMLPMLPNQVPVHWGIDGQPDRYADKLTAILLMPAIGVMLYVVLGMVGTRYDFSRADNREAFHFLTNVIISFCAVMQVATLGEGLGWQIDITRVVTVGLGVVLILTGNIMGRVQPNAFFGYRTFWTLTDPKVWRRTHRVGARVMVAEGVLVALMGLVLPSNIAVIGILVVLLPASAFMVGYSWWLWRTRNT